MRGDTIEGSVVIGPDHVAVLDCLTALLEQAATTLDVPLNELLQDIWKTHRLGVTRV